MFSSVVRCTARIAAPLASRRTVADIPSLMSDTPLALPSFMWRAERLYPDKTMTTDWGAGPEVRTYQEYVSRCRKMGWIMRELGIEKGGRAASMAFNSNNHMDLWFGVPCSSRILHTLNPRLFPEQLVYIVNHGEDEAIFVEKAIFPLIWRSVDEFKTVRKIVVMDDGSDGELPDDPRIVRYETLMDAADEVEFDVDDERRPAGLCYTSGTTGMPKAVVYTHRSQYLHAMSHLFADVTGIRERDVILPVVPCFHANAWGLCHSAIVAGSDLVFCGRNMTGPHLANLIEREKVTVTAGVPTIWMGVIGELAGRDLSHLRMLPVGGSAVPLSLSKKFKEVTGHHITQAWGMTETSPLGSMFTIPSRFDNASEEELDDLRETIGYPVPGVESRIVDMQTGKEAPWDGKSSGELEVRGPWVCSAYYKPEGRDESHDGEWLKTGDVATINEHGFIRLVDRSKDVIKSGGEWVSSADVENIIMSHPKVKEAAVIAVKSKRWMERPMACVVMQEGETMTRDELNEFLAPQMAKWWLPDHMEIIDEIPKTAVGKFSKKDLRARFDDVEVA